MKERTFVKSDFSPIFRHFTNVLCNRVKVNNLPEEIDEKFFLYHVLLYGRVLFFKYKEKYHVFWFSGRGHLNEYYIQNEFLVTNPWMPDEPTFTKYFTPEEAVVVYSDIHAYLENADCGLYELVKEYSEMIESIDFSIKAIVKNSRLIAILTGNDNSFVESAKVAIDVAFKGDSPFVIMEESLIDNIKANPISEKMDYKLSELIKARQYYISDFYQKLGVSANMNMKKERLTDNESELIDSVSCVDFKHILDYLNSSIEVVNKLFSLNISFELNEDKDEDDEQGEDKKDEEDSESSQGDKKDSVGSSDDKGDEQNGDKKHEDSGSA
ncbi:MAG: hypothetical protein MJZ03_04575 [archaeon]|nr:hypothetical protein [archaeon]